VKSFLRLKVTNRERRGPQESLMRVSVVMRKMEVGEVGAPPRQHALPEAGGKPISKAPKQQHHEQHKVDQHESDYKSPGDEIGHAVNLFPITVSEARGFPKFRLPHLVSGPSEAGIGTYLNLL
jgi:hypothetical protein